MTDLSDKLKAELEAGKLALSSMSKGDEAVVFRNASDLKALMDLATALDGDTFAYTTLATRIR